jgi:hypothetical protein
MITDFENASLEIQEKVAKAAQAGKASAIVRASIKNTLARLASATEPSQVKATCAEALSWLNGQYPGADQFSTRNTYISAYRAAVKAYYSDNPIPDGLTSERQTTKGLIRQHLALDLLFASAEDYAKAGAKTQAKTAAQRDNLTPVAIEPALAAIEAGIKSTDWRELAAALILAIQSRPSDILKSGDFEAASKYKVRFTTRAKQRGGQAVGEVFTLIPAVDFVDGIGRLRRDPSVAALKNAQLFEIDSSKNSTVNLAVKRIFGDVIAPPYGETELSCKNLRAVGTVIGWHLYSRADQAIGRFAELQLIHDNAASAANYEDYYCVDTQGERLGAVGMRQDEPLDRAPKSATRSSMRVDQLTLSEIESFGFEGTRAEQLTSIIGLARKAAKLERQLEYQVSQNHKLRAELAALQGSEGQGDDSASGEPATGLTGDVRHLSDADLKGKRPGYAAERIRRSMLAIQDYNAGRELAEQIEINVGSLRKLAAASAVAVGDWVKAHAEEINTYSTAQGHPGGPDSKFNRGKDIAALIPLDWNM